IWSSLLNIEKIGTGDNFFDLGGNSLLAIRLVSAIRKEYKIELGINIIFQLNTIKLLANYLIYEELVSNNSNGYSSIKI
ncbi:phosphopantetheine-binding protein, partial [Pedobacter jeongneungensis]|uniref:phosphopantetheine-binding protein n=1 Tax=Pedobacter jeongneungensis TaxID=947309 RepID=UPI0031ED05C7